MAYCENKKCYICGSEDIEDTGYSLRDNNSIKVLRCKRCSLVFLSSFEHIDENFYKDGKMHSGLFEHNRWLKASYDDDRRRFFMLKSIIKDKKVLDFGCGAGGFLLMAKDFASEVVGIEQQDDIRTLLRENNIEIFDNLDQLKDKYDVITMFHVLEHLPDPKSVIQELLKKLGNNGNLIIEVPNEDDALLSLYGCKKFANFTHWSCHLYSFNSKTLKKLLGNLDVKINYIKPVQRYGLANHLYWLIKGEKGGHIAWKKFDNNIINFFYKNFLKLMSKTDTLVVSISKNSNSPEVLQQIQ